MIKLVQFQVKILSGVFGRIRSVLGGRQSSRPPPLQTYDHTTPPVLRPKFIEEKSEIDKKKLTQTVFDLVKETSCEIESMHMLDKNPSCLSIIPQQFLLGQSFFFVQNNIYIFL